jgi:hypothetical protein
MSNVTKHPAVDDVHRRKFVKAWEEWVRGTAKDLIETPDFDTMMPLLEELRVCHDVFEVLMGAAIRDEAAD